MPDTVEGRVRCHQLAQDRMRRGQPSWEGRLEFMAQLGKLAERLKAGDETLTPQMLLDGFHAAAKEVREKVPEARGDIVDSEHEDLEFFVAELEGWTVQHIEKSRDIFDEFDEALERLYDWCDEHRWWIEPAA